MRITVEHARSVRGFSKRGGFCVRGIRRWFEQYGLDFADFLKNGIEEEDLLATNDPLAKKVVEQAHGKQ